METPICLINVNKSMAKHGSSISAMVEWVCLCCMVIPPKKTRWKPRTRMYSRSWTTSANLCNRKTNRCLHASCGHKEDNYQHNNITTSTTKSQPAQQYHQRNEITTKSPTQQHHQHSNITSTTRSPPPATLHTLPTAHSTLYTLHSTLRTLHFTLHTPHSTLYTLHFYTLHLS